MTDKAVSTEDLVIEIPRNASLDAARLEAVIKTLVESKAEALKNSKRKSSSITSSPKLLINKLRGTSTSTVSSKDKDEPSSTQSQTSRHKVCGCQENPRKDSRICQKCGIRNYQRTSSLTPTRSLKHSKVHHCDRILHFSEEDGNSESFLQRSQECGASMLDCSEVCYCRREPNGEIRMHFDDDYISLKIEDCEDLDWDEAAARRSLRRSQRKKRRRRKRRLKKQMAISAMAIPVVSEEYKDLDPDELSQRARWTIVVTACLLLFMCLLLVGITLRMAPIIDDMVRKENEELMNSLSHDPNIHKSLRNLTASVPSA